MVTPHPRKSNVVERKIIINNISAIQNIREFKQRMLTKRSKHLQPFVSSIFYEIGNKNYKRKTSMEMAKTSFYSFLFIYSNFLKLSLPYKRLRLSITFFNICELPWIFLWKTVEWFPLVFSMRNHSTLIPKKSW